MSDRSTQSWDVHVVVFLSLESSLLVVIEILYVIFEGSFPARQLKGLNNFYNNSGIKYI